MLTEDTKPKFYISDRRLIGAGSVFGTSATLFDDTVALFDSTTVLFGGSDRVNSGFLPSLELVESPKPKQGRIINR